MHVFSRKEGPTMKWHGGFVFVLCLSTSISFAQNASPTKSGTTKSGSSAPGAAPRNGAAQPGAQPGATPRPQGNAGTSGTGAAPATKGGAPAAKPAAGGASATPGAAGAAGAGAAAPSGQNVRDYASYAIGLDMASRFTQDETPVSIEQLIQGLKDGFAGAKPRYPEAQLRAAAEAFDKEMQVRSQERFKLVSERNKKDGAAFLAENKKKKTVKSLPSGLQYEVLKPGAGKSPKVADKIKANYHGTLVDGTVFDTTENDGPVEIMVNEAIAGWTEALQIMKVGDKWRLYIPPELAYGAEGFGPVPPNAVLVFDLELLEVGAAAPPAGTPVGQGTLPRPIK